MLGLFRLPGAHTGTGLSALTLPFDMIAMLGFLIVMGTVVNNNLFAGINGYCSEDGRAAAIANPFGQALKILVNHTLKFKLCLNLQI